MIVLYFLFHGLHFATALRMLRPVLCFHMTSFNYDAKGVRDVDAACRCHQSNIMPDGIFSVNIAQCIICLFVFCFVLFYVCIKRWYSGLFLFGQTGSQFYHYYINGLKEALSYDGLRTLGLISFKWGFLLGGCLWIPNNEFHLGLPLLFMVYCFLARDVAVAVNTTYKIGCCDWILIQPCSEVDNAMC